MKSKNVYSIITIVAILLQMSIATAVDARISTNNNIKRTTAISDPPTVMPTDSPTIVPSLEVPLFPTISPTNNPTLIPTDTPSFVPTALPTVSQAPTLTPSVAPTKTSLPTRVPTFPPTFRPTVGPTVKPTHTPSFQPSAEPTGTKLPTVEPTVTPTAVPTTSAPSRIPVFVKTLVPTIISVEPTIKPTRVPSTGPSRKPTAAPTSTDAPTEVPSFIPTLQPTTLSPTATRSPTLQPSQRTDVPTVTNAAPVIVSLAVSSVTTSSAQVSASFLLTAPYAGQLYCGVLPSGAVLTSISQITSQGVTAPFAATALTPAPLTLTGLSALSAYDVYCYTTNILNKQSTLTQVAATKMSFTAACCRGIGFTNAPAYVVGTPSYYSVSQRSSFVYSFALSALPGVSLSVTPTLTGAGRSQVTATPAYVNFTSSSPSTTGSFVLTAPDSFTGTLTLSLSLSGASQAQFTSIVKQNVTILSPTSNAPVPGLLSAQFSSSGASLLVAFDSATDKAGIAASAWPCSQLFSFASAALMECSWVNSSAVKVSFGTYNASLAYPEAGDSLTLLNHTIRANSASHRYNVEQSVTVLSPVTAIVPSVVLLVPSLISTCDNLTVSAALSSGSGGRPFVARVWTVSSVGASPLKLIQIQSLLNALAIDAITGATLTIPSSLLDVATYSLTLSLTNYFGATSSTTMKFEVSDNGNIPSLTIVGGSVVTIVSSSELVVYAATVISGCSNTYALTYSWQLLLNGAEVPGAASVSQDPSAYILAPYALAAGQVYTLTVSANVPLSGDRDSVVVSAACTVVVAQGTINAVIRGGSAVQVLSTGSVTLDASSSVDQNAVLLANSSVTDTTASALNYRWSCSLASILGYGSSCDAILGSQVTTKASVAVNGSALDSSRAYSLNVVVTAADGRVGTASTVLTVFNTSVAIANRTATTFISSRVVRINPATPVTLFGYVVASTAVTAGWTVTSGNSAQTFTALTPTSKLFPASIVNQRTSYPLVVAASQFQPGAALTFQLAITDAVTGYLVYSQLQVEVNAPPTGGFFAVAPTSGQALHTPFTASAGGWNDDPADYPLTYDFTYSAVRPTDSNRVTMKSRNTLSSATSVLSAGDSHNGYSLFVVMTVYDSYLTPASLTQSIVVSAPAVDVSAYLSSQLTSAFSSSNVNQATNAINAAGNSISEANCTSANSAFCAGKNREACSGSNTCGACLSGFYGISGASNVRCRSSATEGLVGAACTSGDDCLYGNCSASVCVEPNMRCPSLSASLDCSGHGACEYFDISGNLKDRPCSISNQFCNAICNCRKGYGGADCSIDNSTMASRDALRNQLCSAIVRVANTSNPSMLLLQQLTNSLALSFSPYEVMSADTYTQCVTALSEIALLANSGYLIGADPTITQNLIALANKFVVNSVSSLSAYRGNSSFAVSVNSIIAGLANSVAAGQSSLTIATENLRISVRRDLATDLYTAVLEAPPTDSELAYGYLPSTISLSPQVAALCDSGNGYAKMSVLQWHNSPYNDKSLGSPVVRTDATTCTHTGTRRRRLTDVWTNSSRTERYADNTEMTNALFYINLQFASPQNFDFSKDPNEGYPAGSNLTFPQCRIYNGAAFVPCDGCSISHYTNYNVTYACFDGSVLCGGCGSESAHSAAVPSAHFVASEPADVSDWLEADDEAAVLMQHYYDSLSRGVVHTSLTARFASARQRAAASVSEGRQLQSLSGDDDGSTSVGLATSGQFAAIFGAVEKELVIVLSFNPFNIDPEKAKPILIFVGILFFVIFGGFVYFIRWDRYDHNMMLYSDKMSFQREVFAKKEEMDMKDSKYDRAKYMELKKFFQDKREQLDNRKAWAMQKKGVSFIAKRKCAVTGELLKDGSDKMVAMPTHAEMVRFGNIGDENTERDYLVAAKIVGYDTILDIPSVNTEFVATHDRFIINTVGAFLTYVIPIHSRETFPQHIGRKHDYLSYIAEPSLFMNRTNRWMNLCIQLMLALFIDTVFFGMFFPDQGTCEAFHAESDCESPINKATNQPLCSWTRKNSDTLHCQLNFPPNTITFIVLVAFLTIIFAVPISFVYDWMRIKICTHRPAFDYESLFGACLQSSTKLVVNENNKHSALKDLYDDIDEKRAKDADYQMHLMAKSNEEYERNAVEEVNQTARRVYDNVTSSSEEVDQILVEVKMFLNKYILTSKAPWNHTFSSEEIRTKATAIQRFIGVYPDGTPVRLSLWDYFRYGTAREKLRKKLLGSRKRADRIVLKLHKMGDIEANNKDMSLIQYFVLEQFDPIKRYALRYQFFDFPVSTPNTINGLVWLGTWAFLFGTLLFFIYWTLAWGVQSGARTFRSWGLNFVLSFCQDVFLIELAKIYILYVMAMFSIRPQLRFIYSTLNKIAIRYAQEGASEKTDIRVVQHLSASCRASRNIVCRDLAAAKILSQVDDTDIRECRQNGRTPLPWIAYLIVLIPALMTLIANDSLGEMVIGTILPSLLTLFIMVNYYMYTLSLWFLAFVWVAAALYLYYRFYRSRRAAMEAKKAAKRKSIDATATDGTIAEQKVTREVRLSNRSKMGASLKNFTRYCREWSLDLFYGLLRIIALPVVCFRKWRNHVVRDRTPHIWCGVNMPHETQGRSDVSVREENFEPPLENIPLYIQSMLASEWRGHEWTEARRTPFLIGLMNKHLLNVQLVDLPTTQKAGRPTSSSASSFVKKRSSFSASRSTPQRIKSDRSISLSLDESLVVLEEHKSVTGSEVPSSVRHSFNLRKPKWVSPVPKKRVRQDPSWESEQGREFRDKFTVTSDEHVALRRMLLKFLGERQASSKMGPYGLTAEMRQLHRSIPEKVADYEGFNDLIRLSVCADILSGIYTIYHPDGQAVDEEELHGVMEEYKHWSETSKNIDEHGWVPYAVFQEWFLTVNRKLVKYRAVIVRFGSNLDLLTAEDLEAQEQWTNAEALTAVEISGLVFREVVRDLATGIAEDVLDDRITVLAQAREVVANRLLSEVVNALTRDVATDFLSERLLDSRAPRRVSSILSLSGKKPRFAAEHPILTTSAATVACMTRLCAEVVGELAPLVAAEAMGEVSRGPTAEELEELVFASVVEEALADLCDFTAEDTLFELSGEEQTSFLVEEATVLSEAEAIAMEEEYWRQFEEDFCESLFEELLVEVTDTAVPVLAKQVRDECVRTSQFAAFNVLLTEVLRGLASELSRDAMREVAAVNGVALGSLPVS